MTTEAALRSQIIQKAWEDSLFRQSLSANPKEAIREAFGIELPAHVDLKVLEETPEQCYLVIPPNPSAILVSSIGEEEPESNW